MYFRLQLRHHLWWVITFFLADPDNPFRKSMVYNILTREGNTASIPCLATDPSLDSLRLETCSSQDLASGLQFSPNLEQGILIHNTQKAYEGCYVCAGRLGEQHVKSHHYFLTVKPGKVVWMHAGCCFKRSLTHTQVENSWIISFQFPMLPLWLRCRRPKDWFLPGIRVSTSPATPPTSTETSN